MRYCFWLFCAVCVAIWLIGWGIIAAEWIARRRKLWSKMSLVQKIGASKRVSRGLLIIPLLLIFGGCCVKNTPLQTDVPCTPIYGRTLDWDVISDDLGRNIYRHNLLCEELNRE